MKENIPAPPATPCWIWPKSNHAAGYACVTVDGRRRLLHRMMYELAIGPIAAEMTIDHLCRNRLCVRPDHLEVVPFVVNVMRGVSPTANKARQDVCTKGLHPLSGDNLMIEYDKKGRTHRRCKRCRYSKHWILPRDDDSPMLPRRKTYPQKNKEAAK